MRTMITLAVAAITIPVLAYTFMPEDAATGHPQAVISENGASSGAEVQGALDKLAKDFEHYQLTSQAQFQRAQQDQARLSAELAVLNARLGSIETAASEPGTNVVGRNSVEPSTDAIDFNDGTGKPESRKVSEADLGHWIDETFRVGSGDAHLTAQATEQAAMSLGKLTNINLDTMQCDERFCRATFTKTNGKEPDIQALYGEPPFLTEGFTLYEADGRISLYFTQPGVTLAELRGEAQNF